MFRQQLYGFTALQAYKNVKDEGITMLYRGIRPPLLQAVVSKSIMFGLYNWFDELLELKIGRHLYTKLLSAALSGTTEAILTPFERAQTLLQTPKFNTKITSSYDALVHINRHGLREHYRGLTAVLLRNGPANMLFFGLRDPIRTFLPSATSSTSKLLNDFFSGALLGAAISTITYPINVARTRMQSVYGGRFIGPFEALQLTYDERGRCIRRLYRGVYMNFIRSLLSWGIINSAYEKLKSIT
ncbi:unnamed protein product [Albugo candida]|nr:unnamed protein product [Albugo candida]|eukprot:CCI50386.1 unnamed protein product [Albugo candida]